ncbi:MAG: sugar transferase [Eubacterium sp.]|nr:sugar transferase [Eubacterium sp.]
MNRRTRMQLFFEFIIDIFCLILANAFSICLFYFIIPKIPTFPAIEWIRLEGTLFLAYLVIFFGFHRNINTQNRNRKSEVAALVRNATLIFALFAVLIILLKNPIVESRYMLFSTYLTFIGFSAIGRYFLKRYLTGFYKNSKTASRAIIITTSDRADNFVKSIKDDWSVYVTGIVLLDRYCQDNVFKFSDPFIRELSHLSPSNTEVMTLPGVIHDIPVLSTDDGFIDIIRSSPTDEVFLNLPYTDDLEIQEIIEELEDMGITVHINIPTLDDILDESKFDNINCKMQYGYPMASFAANPPRFGYLFAKRAFDLLFGIIGCILSVPVILITAVPLLHESKGPLIFKQQRVGLNGRVFNIYKLRSMYVDAEERKKELVKENQMEGYMFKMENDPRVTKVGRVIRKLSIDELPQFFNVVKGDMSLVGTRPPTIDEFEKYESRHKRRLSMRPGITGMWQVSGRSEIQSFEEVVKLDCEYIDNCSALLDLKILFKTVGVVLTHKGAH